MKMLNLIMLVCMILFNSCTKKETENMETKTIITDEKGMEKATFAAGCFWCVEASFNNLSGVKHVISGYSGGHVKNPTYEQVCSGTTGHVEAIQIIFDPKVISFSELLDVYWKQFDPTDGGGSFNDRGEQYMSVIFYNNDEQKTAAEKSKKLLDKSGIFSKSIATKITPFTSFYPAEDYHQDYSEKNPVRYNAYKKGSGREDFILGLWGDKGTEKYRKPDKEEVKKKLNDLQYKVTQSCGTEQAFNNEFWDKKEEGIYVDIVTGEPLFCSKDKYDSGSGWPSFTKPIDTRYVVKEIDSSLYMQRVEVKSKFGGSHLGHVFNDGPEPTNLRYCINSASLKFIPKDKMKEQGYAEWLWIFN